MQFTRQPTNTMEPYVPQHFKDTTGINQKEGEGAEMRFKRICGSYGYKVDQATRNENYRQHIDCWVTVVINDKYIGRFSVDVKAAKRIARRDRNGNFAPVQDKLHWVEWTNRGGGNGWVRGHADKIAFGMCDGSFTIVRRQALEDYIGPIIESKRNYRPRNQFDCVNGVLWKRYGNKDEMTMVTTDELYALPGTFGFRFQH